MYIYRTVKGYKFPVIHHSGIFNKLTYQDWEKQDGRLYYYNCHFKHYPDYGVINNYKLFNCGSQFDRKDFRKRVGIWHFVLQENGYFIYTQKNGLEPFETVIYISKYVFVVEYLIINFMCCLFNYYFYLTEVAIKSLTLHLSDRMEL